MGEEVAVSEGGVVAPEVGEQSQMHAAAPLFLFQVLLIFLFAYFADFDNGGGNGISLTLQSTQYSTYMDLHLMVFIGFGFLMMFMRRFSFSAVGYSLILGVLALQYAILIRGFFDHVWDNDFTSDILISINGLIHADYAAATILISLGAVLGKARLNQLIVMVIFEVTFYVINYKVSTMEFDAVDEAGSMLVHGFGAYFGLAVSFMITNNARIDEAGDRFVSSYMSDSFAMAGTLFLFVFWPSWNGALVGTKAGDQLGAVQQRVVINTVLALTQSTIGAVMASKYFRPDHKLNMVDVQNATLAGGVAVGSCASMMIAPWASLTIGLVAGIVSVFGYVHIQPVLENYNIHDSCGIHNLHGLPGVIGGIAGAIATATMDGEHTYGLSNEKLIPAMTEGRGRSQQAAMQTLHMIVTVAIAVGSGVVTGKIMNLMGGEEVYAEDAVHWSMEWEQTEETKDAV